MAKIDILKFGDKSSEVGVHLLHWFERDNVRDHRAGTCDHQFSKDAQDRLRVHHIVIRANSKLLLLRTQEVSQRRKHTIRPSVI